MPQLPPEIIGHILSELVHGAADSDGFAGEVDTRTLRKCCLVSKAFLELAWKALYLRRPLIFSGEGSDDSVNLDGRTLKHGLALLVTPHLASYARSLSVDVHSGLDLFIHLNLIHFALLGALRASPSIRHLELDFTDMREHLQEALPPIADTILFAKPNLRTFVYSAEIFSELRRFSSFITFDPPPRPRDARGLAPQSVRAGRVVEISSIPVSRIGAGQRL